MYRLLLKKYIGETWLLWSACAAVMLFFPWVRLWTISQFELSGFAPLIEQFQAFEKFSPVPLSQFLTYEGVIGLTFAEPVLLLALLTFAIARGTDVVSGELGRGTLEMLLAQPISRLQVMTAHGLVSLGGLFSLGILCWLGIYAGIQTNTTPVAQTPAELRIPGTSIALSNPFIEKTVTMTPLSELVTADLYLASTVNFLGLGYFVFCLSVFMSSWDLYRWRSIGLVISVYVSQLLLFILSKSHPSTRFLMPLSFFGAYQPDWMVQAIHRQAMPAWTIFRIAADAEGFLGKVEIGPLGYSLILFALGSILYLAAYRIFRRRDLPAPS
jgi:ABC-2 type transport system permease protein